MLDRRRRIGVDYDGSQTNLPPMNYCCRSTPTTWLRAVEVRREGTAAPVHNEESAKSRARRQPQEPLESYHDSIQLKKRWSLFNLATGRAARPLRAQVLVHRHKIQSTSTPEELPDIERAAQGAQRHLLLQYCSSVDLDHWAVKQLFPTS
jgi:hypothetical protein